MKWIGPHVSIAGGLRNAPENAIKIGARAYPFFTRNQRQWKIPLLFGQDIRDFRKKCREHDFFPSRISAHDSYPINLGNPKKTGVEKPGLAFVVELNRCYQVGIPCLDFHPGNLKNLISKKDRLMTQ